jgi:transcriptional regulator GlxA family with amidase domain
VAEPLQISGVAAAIGVSERTLQRATAAVLGMSPIDFLHEIRLDEATFLLRTTNQTVDAVAAAVGYQNTSTLRTLVRRRRGTTISALRQVVPALDQRAVNRKSPGWRGNTRAAARR